MYNYFPTTTLNLDNFSTLDLVDITITTKIKDILSEYEAVALSPYTIINGERPDVVSQKLYDTPFYDYIILMVNGIKSLYDDWPKDDVTFKNYIIKKYGSIAYARNTTAYWYNSQGHVVSQEFWNTLPTSGKYTESFLTYETRLNNEKTLIRVLDYPLVVKFESDIQTYLSQ